MLSSLSEYSSLIAVIGNKICNISKNEPTIITQVDQKLDARDANNQEKCGVGALCSALSSSKSFFAYCDDSKCLRIFDIKGRLLKVDQEHILPKKVGCMAFTPDEKYILLGEKSGGIQRFSCIDKALNKETEDKDELLGHLSLLTCVVTSKDGRLIGTCDRDEKIRVSRFSQPYVIESFCLGHTKPISEVAFFDDVHLVSVAGDGYLRLWHALEGTQLDAIDISEVMGRLSDNTHKDQFLVSRLLFVGDVIVLGIRSHNCIIAVRMVEDRTSFIRHNDSVQAAGVWCPEGYTFVDCCVTRFDGKNKAEVVCLAEPITRLISWSLTFDEDTLNFGQVEEWNDLPAELKDSYDTFPRLQILTDMSKSFIDSSGIDAYEASKAETHRRIKERHQRHQSRRKRAKQEVVEEAVGSSAGDSANEKQEEEQTIKPCVD